MSAGQSLKVGTTPWTQPNVNMHIREGDRLLVFEEQLLSTSNPCAVVFATPENLRAARQGASEDLSDHFDLPYLPAGSVNPPSVKVE